MLNDLKTVLWRLPLDHLPDLGNISVLDVDWAKNPGMLEHLSDGWIVRDHAIIPLPDSFLLSLVLERPITVPDAPDQLAVVPAPATDAAPTDAELGRALRFACDAVGIDHDVDALIRHHRRNAAAIASNTVTATVRRADAEIPDWQTTGGARGEGWGTRGNECEYCPRYMFEGTENGTRDAWREHYAECPGLVD